MKAYNLKATTQKLPFGELDAIALGEKGRGRVQTIVPCPLGIANEDVVSIAMSTTGKPKIVKGGDSSGWIARISTNGSYIRDARGWIGVLNSDKEKVAVIAKGYGAFGDAGRTGTWDDVILSVKSGTILRVKLTRANPSLLYFPLDDSVPQFIGKEYIDAFSDSLGIALSIDKDNYANVTQPD